MEFQTTLNNSTMPVLVLWRLAIQNKDDLFALVYHELLQRGWIRETYLEAVKQREQEYPTGLDFGEFAIALPHIDPEHVLHPAMVMTLVEEPIHFQAMDDPSLSHPCRLAIFPVLAAAGDQLLFLSAVATALQQPGFYAILIAQESPEGAAALLDSIFATYVAET